MNWTLSKQESQKSKLKINTRAFIQRHYPNAKTTSDKSEYVLYCLWCASNKRKLYISSYHGAYQCFKCGAKGSFYSFVKKTLENQNLTSTDSIRDYLLQFTSVDTLEQEIQAEVEKNIIIDYPEYYEPLYDPTIVGEIGKEAIFYLHNRGVTDEQIAYYRLGYCAAGWLANRIIIPVFDDNYQLVSYVARDFTGYQTPKVLTPPGNGTEGIKQYVFNLQSAKHTRTLYIGEGVFDAMALGIHGVALFGKTATQTQMNAIIISKPLKIYCCLDADAQKENAKLAYELSFHCENVYLVSLPDGDPASIPLSHLELAINNAKPYAGWPDLDI